MGDVMRIDGDHRRMLSRAQAKSDTGEAMFRADTQAMVYATRRLSAWENGLLGECLLRAAMAKKPSKEQRVLLALFAAREIKEAV